MNSPAQKINLLPRSLAVGKKTTKLARDLKTIATACFALFVIFIASGIVAVFILNSRLKNIEARQETLKTNIKAAEKTEAALVLLKDRLGKIQTILDNRVNEERFAKQSDLVASLPADFNFIDSQIEPESSKLGIVATNGKSMEQVVTNLSGNTSFVKLVLDSIVFSPLAGYRLNLEVF